MQCTGDKKEICGGSRAITVYMRDGTGGGAGGGEGGSNGGDMECYRDDGVNRKMTLAFLESDSMTHEVKHFYNDGGQRRMQYASTVEWVNF